VIAATLVVAGTIITYVGTIDLKMPLALFGASLFIATVGLADDVKSIPVLPRLALQALAVSRKVQEQWLHGKYILSLILMTADLDLFSLPAAR